MNIGLISSILNHVWAIDQQVAISYSSLISNFLGESKVDFELGFTEDSFNEFSVVRETSSYSNYSSYDKAPTGSIAVIPLNGPLMKDNQYCGPVGMATIGERIKAADQHHNIDGIILKIDSPGGTVDGTKALADIVKATEKPIIAFVDGLMASAALWIGSAADEIIAADNKTRIGSVGVLLSFMDVQPAYEKLGVKFHNIVASQSKDKTKAFDEIRAGEYDNYKKDFLDPLAADFIEVVKTNLPGATDEHLTGKVFFAENVIGVFADSIGNFDSAVQRMSELIDQNKPQEINTNPSTSMKHNALLKVLGLDESPESQEEGTFFNDDQLTAIEAALQVNQGHAAELAAAQKNSDDLQALLDSANSEIATLKEGPGAESAQVIVKKDTVVSKSEDDNVSSNDKTFLENLETVGENYL